MANSMTMHCSQLVRPRVSSLAAHIQGGFFASWDCWGSKKMVLRRMAAAPLFAVQAMAV